MAGDDTLTSSPGDMASSSSISHLALDPVHAQSLTEAIDRVLVEAWPSIKGLLGVVHDIDALPPEARLGIFGIVGRYLHVLHESRINQNMDLQICHMTATHAIMGDPKIVAFIEGILSSQIDGMVGRLVE